MKRETTDPGSSLAARSRAATPEPAPVPQGGEPPVWELVREDLRLGDPVDLPGLQAPRLAIGASERHALGIAKYGTPLQASNGRNHLADAYQESLDLAVYLRAELERHPDEAPHIRYLYVQALRVAGSLSDVLADRGDL